VESVEHLEHTLRSVFTHIDATAKNLTRGIEHDQFHVVPLTHKGNAIRQLAKHVFVQQIMFGAIQGHPGNAGFNAMLDKLELFGWTALWLGSDLNTGTAFHGGLSSPAIV
jgi:hypothetical protein